MVIAVALAAALAVAAPQPVAAQGEGKAYGKALSGAQSVKISQLVADPGSFVGKTVRVEGLVVDVCPKRGCWMDLATEADSKKIRIKVDDGVIVFPVDAKGSHAVAEGVFTKVEMTQDEAKAYAKELAEERGHPADAEKAADAPRVTYQIRATGAVIK